MKVKLLNKIETKKLFKTWGDFSKVCYNTEKVNPAAIGKHCLESGHFSGSRATYINFSLKEVPRSTMNQLSRKTVGMVINVRSQRYCDESNFDMYVPSIISENSYLNGLWENHKTQSQFVYQETKRILEQEHNFVGEKANELARGVLPIDTYSECTVGFTLEGLIDFMNKRLCVRSQAPIRQLATLIKKEVLKVLPEIEEYLVPKCQAQLFCSEKHGCGQAPTKMEVLSLVDYAITCAEKQMIAYCEGEDTNAEG